MVGMLVHTLHRPVRLAVASLVFGLLTLPPAAAAAEELPSVDAQVPWTLELENARPRAPYTLYKRMPAGSPYAAYRLEATLDASPEAVARAARQNMVDLDADPMMKRTIVRNEGDVVVVHSYIPMSPLISDRDVVTRTERRFDPATQSYHVVWNSTNDEGPPPADGVIRLARSDGSWLFEPLPGGRTRVTYESHTEIAGSLPAWLINSMMNQQVVNGFEGLRARGERNGTRADTRAAARLE